MIAVAILTLAVSGAFLAANSALVAAELTRDQLIASYLAQEGIEYVRMVRDDAFLANYPDKTSQAWAAFLSEMGADGCNTAVNAKGCELDPVSQPGTSPLTACTSSTASSTGCGQLYLASTTAYTLQSSGNTPTPYTREIWATDKTFGSEKDEQISSKVSWEFHGQPYSITVTDDLTPWQ